MPELKFGERLKRSWNAFFSREPTRDISQVGYGSSYRPDKRYPRGGSEKTILAAIKTRIAIDVSKSNIRHVKLDEKDRFLETVNSGLNECLTIEANIDQSSDDFMRDLVESMFDEGVIAAVPIETNRDPETGPFDIYSMRVGRITQWFPKHIRVEVYNESTGMIQELTCNKRNCAIIPNPFYSVMNAPNSTFKRYVRKLSLLDYADEEASSGKLDMIIKLPYTIRSEARQKQADERRKSVEMQLVGSKYGIAYIDGTEEITQLNRPLENNLLNQIQYLTTQVYSQLGITEAILNGTAKEEELNQYHTRTVAVIVEAICKEFNRKYITKTARTQRQTITHFRDPFEFLPSTVIADFAEKFIKNEILSPNEMRQLIGIKASSDPKAEELRNRQMRGPDVMGTEAMPPGEEEVIEEEGANEDNPVSVGRENFRAAGFRV